MALSPYDSCPCGSGKKFKWCCTAYFDQIELALQQQQKGQHDAAIRTMVALTTSHPKQPQIWAYYANILQAEGKTEEAEKALQTAFQLQPNFAMGYLLRGLFRQGEGEVLGALMLFRKADEHYHPDAKDQIAQVCEMIAKAELMFNRVVACRYALERAVNNVPEDQELREQFEALFGEDSRLPEPARKGYKFRPTLEAVPTEGLAKLTDAKAAYEQLTKKYPEDPAAWFNLGLTHAWLGEQPQALEAVNKSITLEVDDYRAEEAAALAEVLKCAQGMESEAEHVEHRAMLQIRDPEPVAAMIQSLAQSGRLMAAQMDETGSYFSALLIEPVPSLLETGTKLAKVVGNINLSGAVLRFWHPSEEQVRNVAGEFRQALNLAVTEPQFNLGPVQFGDIVLDALAYPVRTSDAQEAETKLRDFATNYFEGTWLHKPQRSLGGVGPVDAVGSSLMRKRLLGIIKFLEGCLIGAAPRMKSGNSVVPLKIYDFNKLRHKLGIEMKSVAAPASKMPALAAPKREFAAMNAGELSALKTAELGVAELEDAMKAAIKLDARELAVAFAKAGVDKPEDTKRPDRYPFYACLMTAALATGDTNEVLSVAEAGLKYDTENNDGKRFNDFALRKVAVLAKKQDYETAEKEFDRILERNPNDGNMYVKATEAMLSGRQGTRAVRFAERGLAFANSSGNRDLQAACKELLEAAKKYS